MSVQEPYLGSLAKQTGSLKFVSDCRAGDRVSLQSGTLRTSFCWRTLASAVPMFRRIWGKQSGIGALRTEDKR